jgi:Putative peptidoglycan binding domain
LKLRRKQLAGLLVLIAAGLFWPGARGRAAESGSPSKKAAPPKATKRAVHRRASHRRHSSRHRRSRFRYRLARLHLEPGRIEEIQKALIREGYLKQEANGRWDDATRSAMRNYQQANGFDVTGLPEAKPLMKLGLGPHPLPAELDPTPVGSARIGSAPEAGRPASDAAAPSGTENQQ